MSSLRKLRGDTPVCTSAQALWQLTFWQPSAQVQDTQCKTKGIWILEINLWRTATSWVWATTLYRHFCQKKRCVVYRLVISPQPWSYHSWTANIRRHGRSTKYLTANTLHVSASPNTSFSLLPSLPHFLIGESTNMCEWIMEKYSVLQRYPTAKHNTKIFLPSV